MVIAGFSFQDKLRKIQFFQKTFLVADTRMKVVLGMFFLTFSNVDIWFTERELVWKIYSAAETLLTTQKVEIIDKKEFATVTLNKENKTFVMHIAAFSVDSNVHTSQQAQIFLLDIEKVTISSEYADYTDVFSPNSTTELPKYTDINNHFINLIDDKQPPYGLINSLRPVGLEMLKTYIETNLANSFIRPSNLPISAPILFIPKKNDSFWLYIDYHGLNNLTIKNWYPLSLIGKFLDHLGHAKCFTLFDLTIAYH